VNPASGSAAGSAGVEGRLSREQMAAVIAQRLEPGWVVNLGIGIPTLASSFLRPEDGVVLSSENGVVGYGALAAEGEADPDVVNAGVQAVTLEPGAAILDHASSFALIRGGRLECAVLGAYEVAADGSFSNWSASGEPGLGGIGGAMDLAAGARRLWVAMEHTTREGDPRLVERCALPTTAGPGHVSLLVTDLAVIELGASGLVLREHAPGVDPERIRALTQAPLAFHPTLAPIAL
jgi:3-oxoacid CoA-transferase B subunit